MEVFFELMTVQAWVIVLGVTAACFWFGYKAKQDAKHGLTGNWSQFAISIGVLGTFLGIMLALVKFKMGSYETLAASIAGFIDSMKVAFVTSIIGMVSGIVIKYIQRNADNNRAKQVDCLSEIRDMIKANADTQTAVAENLDLVAGRLNDVVDTMKNSSTTAMAAQMAKLAEAMHEMRDESAAVRAVNEKMVSSMDNQNQQIGMLRDSLEQSSREQLGYLKGMEQNINDMREFSKLSYDISAELFQKSNEFQQGMLDNSAEQLKALKENNQGLADMRVSFDEFLKNMTDNYNKAFIEALTKSIETLNVELQEQFGDNFKRLNEAVEKLLIWQENYKGTIEGTQGELHVFLDSVKEYNAQVVSTMPERLSALGDNIQSMERQIKGFDISLETFNVQSASFANNVAQLSDVLEKNVGVQANMASTTENLSLLAKGVDNYIENLKNTCDSFTLFSQQFLQGIQEAVSKHEAAMADNLAKARGSLEQLVAECENSMSELTRANHSAVDEMMEGVNQFRAVSGNAVQGLGESMDYFSQSVRNSSEGYAQKMEDILSRFSSVVIDGIKNANLELGAGIKQHNAELLGSIAGYREALHNDLAESFENLNSGVQSRLSHSFEGFTSAVDREMQELFSALGESLSEMQENFIGAVDARLNEQLSDMLEKIINKFESSMNKFDENMNNSVQDTMAALKDDMEGMLKEMNTLSQAQVKELGNALVAITNKMTGNYQLLMDRLEALNTILTKTSR